MLCQEVSNDRQCPDPGVRYELQHQLHRDDFDAAVASNCDAAAAAAAEGRKEQGAGDYGSMVDEAEAPRYDEHDRLEVLIVVDKLELCAATVEGRVPTVAKHSPDSPDFPNAAPPTAEEPATAKKRAKRGRLWKKNRGKQKLDKDAEERQADAHPPVPGLEDTSVSSVVLIAAERGGEDSETTKAMREAESPGAEVEEECKRVLEFAESSSLNLEGSHASDDSSSSASSCTSTSCRGTADARAHLQQNEPRGKSKLGLEAGFHQGPGPGPRPGPAKEFTAWKRRASEGSSDRSPFHQGPRARQEGHRSSSVGHVAEIIHKAEQQQQAEAQRAKMQQQHTVDGGVPKNWVPRKGPIQWSEGGSEMRTEQSKGRGKGKQQGRETGPQDMKELARQKFEADLKIKQEELLQKSKQVLKAEFQKAKVVELTRKGRDELEVELDRNLVYFEGELMYLNP